jgi:glycosidase
MNLAAVYHEPKSRYAYPYDAKTLHLRLRTARGDVQAVSLVGSDPFSWRPSKTDPGAWEWDEDAEVHLPMQPQYSTAQHDYWFVSLQPTARFRYAFILQSGSEHILYGCRGFYDLDAHPDFRHQPLLFFNFPYLLPEDVLHTPAWVKDTVWYQIFPERFARGGRQAWNDIVNDGLESFAGGNLQGIIDHLDDIQALGVNGLYLTPIFTSPSTHKYDTTDYYHIDPAFGTNEQFGELVHQAHRRGIRVMLDAVFNHCGWLHPFWQDVVKRGKQSQYFDCFFIDREPVINFDVKEGELPRLTPEMYGKLNYRTFGFQPRMPKWNTAHPLVREHLFGAIRYWTENFSIDGWRLDVSNEISHDFWREFRSLVKSINPEAYIMGENWDNSYPWLMGDQFDGVMNYELSYPIWNLLGTSETVEEPFDVRQYQLAINQLLVSYPKNNLEAMYNLIDSHDTARIAHTCGGNIDKVRLAFALLLTFTGAPSIYYGSELGMAGDGHHNRSPYPWGRLQNLDLRDLVQNLIRLRRQHPSFRAVDLNWLLVDQAANTMIFSKAAGGERLYLLANVSEQEQELALPAELSHRRVLDLLQEAEIDLTNSLLLPPYGFRLLLSSEPVSGSEDTGHQ